MKFTVKLLALSLGLFMISANAMKNTVVENTQENLNSALRNGDDQLIVQIFEALEKSTNFSKTYKIRYNQAKGRVQLAEIEAQKQVEQNKFKLEEQALLKKEEAIKQEELNKQKAFDLDQLGGSNVTDLLSIVEQELKNKSEVKPGIVAKFKNVVFNKYTKYTVSTSTVLGLIAFIVYVHKNGYTYKDGMANLWTMFYNFVRRNAADKLPKYMNQQNTGTSNTPFNGGYGYGSN